MFVLVVDSATPAVTAAVGLVTEDSAVIRAEQVTVDSRAHAERLAPAISAVLAEVGAKPADLTAIVAGTGPGPFTGLRVGLVTAAALGHALGIPTYPVCTLDAFAVDRPGRSLVATDARRREIYWAGYAGGVRFAGPAVDRPDEVADRAVGLGIRQAVGDGAVRYREVLGLPVVDQPRYPSALGLLTLAVERIRGRAPAEPLTPLYLRRPDATEPASRKSVLH